MIWNDIEIGHEQNDVPKTLGTGLSELTGGLRGFNYFFKSWMDLWTASIGSQTALLGFTQFNLVLKQLGEWYDSNSARST